MKHFFGIIGAFLISMSFCCAPNVPKSPDQAKKEFVLRLERETVSLVSMENDEQHTYCAGVWISENRILTAHHCVVDEPIILYTEFESSTPKIAAVLAVEVNDDLALLEAVEDNMPPHPFAVVADEAWAGEHVNIMGHPVGMSWSYMEGVISSMRSSIMTKSTRWTLQIASPAWRGNSGGGAFDDEGRLLGICSFLSKNAPNMTFFTHPGAIKKFLSKNSHT